MKLEEEELNALQQIAQEEYMSKLRSENLALRKRNTGLEIEKRLGVNLVDYSIDLKTGDLLERQRES